MRALPAGWYVDPTRAPLESSRIFEHAWQFVCHVSDLPAPGTAARFDLGTRSAVVVRASDGTLRAWLNACRHRGARLVDGDALTGLAFCVDGRLRCPYHGWSYAETGELDAVPPGHAAAQFDLQAHTLVPLHVEAWRGLVFVAFGLPAHTVAASLDDVAPGWPDARPLRRLAEPRFDAIGADWKLACEHRLDVSHLATARPARKPQVFAPAHVANSGAHALRLDAPLAAEPDGWPARLYSDQLREQAPVADVLFVWPNLWFERTPDALVSTQVLPGPTGRCVVREIWYGAPDSSRGTRLLRYLHARVRRRARRDDAKLLERTQHGLGMLEPTHAAVLRDDEPGVGWFVARCRAALGDDAPLRVAKTATPRKRAARKTATVAEA